MTDNTDFSLFETMLLRPGSEIRRFRLHMQRLAASALALGFEFDESECLRQLQLERNKLPVLGEFRTRLDLWRHGGVSIKSIPIDSFPSSSHVTVLLSEKKLSSDEMALVSHKTSFRLTYDQAIKHAQVQGAFDVLFFNHSGELTEGARTNVFARIDGTWRTPHLNCGALPGTMRTRVLRRWTDIKECSINRDELLRADRIVLSNAVRGLIPATLIERVCFSESVRV